MQDKKNKEFFVYDYIRVNYIREIVLRFEYRKRFLTMKFSMFRLT